MAGSNSWVPSFPSMGFPGGTTVGGGGYPQDADMGAHFRNSLDRQRASMPEATYPDGYLGTITDRREDRMYGALQKRLTERSYQRGVHKGERLGRDSYYWTEECNPDAGIQRQMASAQLDNQEGGTVIRTQRFVQSGNPVEKLAHLGKTAGLTPPEQMSMARQYGVDPAINPLPMIQSDPSRAARYSKMLPRWSGVWSGNAV